MTHVNIDNQDESVKRFALSLSSDRNGSIVELGGKQVLQVFPADQNGIVGVQWSDAHNDRRCELIDKEIDGSITSAEQIELEELQEQMLRYRHRVAPLPLAHARHLLDELERKAAQAQLPSS
jgi:hypothetical protein